MAMSFNLKLESVKCNICFSTYPTLIYKTLHFKVESADYKLSWNIKYSDLSGVVTGAHFHGPAAFGVNADVVVPINGDLSSPIKGEAVLTAEQSAQLLEGKWYINLHTATHPDGEIRGQVVAKQ